MWNENNWRISQMFFAVGGCQNKPCICHSPIQEPLGAKSNLKSQPTDICKQWINTHKKNENTAHK